LLVLERRNSALMLPKLYVVTIDELLGVFHRGLIVGHTSMAARGGAGYRLQVIRDLRSARLIA
jgi:hypothetical protein